MKPLWFLTIRVILNGIRRAFGNPVRAIVTLLIVGWFLCSFGMGAISALYSRKMPNPGAMVLPPLDLSLALLMLLHFFLLLFTFTPTYARSQWTLFTEADVNFLFPTPLGSFKVFRGLLLVRGLIGSIFLMLLVAFYYILIGGQNLRALSAIMEPKVGVWGLLTYPALYLLMMAGLLLLGVLLGLKGFRREGFWLRFWLVAGGIVIAILAMLGYLTLRAMEAGATPMAGVLQSLNHPVLWWLLLPLRAPAEAAMIIYTGWTPTLIAGFGFWAALCVIGHESLRRQEAWLYEYAARVAQKGAEARAAQQNPLQMMYRRVGERAQRGKFRVARAPLLERWTPRGVWALLWRDLLVFWRMNGLSIVLGLAALVVVCAVVLAIAKTMVTGKSGEGIATSLMVVVQELVVIFFVISSLFGLMDLLKRMDLQKPLPLPARWVVMVELLPLILWMAVFEFALLLVASTAYPKLWGLWLYIYIVGLSFIYPASLGLLLLLLMNPDQTDYTQRALVGILMFPMIALCALPGGIVMGLCFFLKVPLLINAVLTILTNAGATAVLVSFTGEKYEHFNPTD